MKSTHLDTPRFRREMDLIGRIYAADEFRMPVRYVLGLTNECNLHCPFCFLEKHGGQERMEAEDWIAVTAQLPEYARVILFGGEPMFYRDFDRVYRHVASRFGCTVVTNGTLLTERRVDLLLSEPGLDEVAISVDTVGNANRDFTAAQWRRLVAGARLYDERRRQRPAPPSLGVATVLLDETAEGLFDLHRFAHEELGCDHVTYCTLNGSDMQLSDRMESHDRLHESAPPPLYEKWDTIVANLERIRAYNRQHGLHAYLRPKVIDLNTDDPIDGLDMLNEPAFPKRRFGPCKLPWSDCRIYGDGHVVSCLAVPFGNFKRTPDLRVILAGPEATRFRRELRQEGFFEKCSRCVFLYDKSFAR